MDVIKLQINMIFVLLSMILFVVPFSYAYANGKADPLSILSEAEHIISEDAPLEEAKSLEEEVESLNAKTVVSDIVPILSTSEKIPLEEVQTQPVENDSVIFDWKQNPQSFANDLKDHGGYVIGPSDKLRIMVYGEKDISKTYQVDGLGIISVPLIGQLKVAGLSLRQVESLLVVALSDGYLHDPSVSVEVAEFRPFYIMGEVRRPGSYNYIDGMSILNAVVISGGFTYRANTKNIEIIRSTTVEGEILKVPSTAHVMPGDIIRVKERFF